MNKIPRVSQNMEAKTLPADVCIFDRFGQLSPAAVHSADWWFDTGVKWWIHVSSIVTYLCKNSFMLHWNQLQTMFWIVDVLLFLIDDEQIRQPLWIPLSHWQMFHTKIMNTLPSNIFNSSAISCNFNLRSAKMSLCNFFCVFPGQLLN